jgi:hypothetical protein
MAASGALQVGALSVLLAASAVAEPAPSSDTETLLLDKIAQLESRVRQLEDEREAAAAAPLEQRVQRLESLGASRARVADWAERIQLSGTTSFGYFDGARDSVFPEGSFDVWDARIFLDADLGADLRTGGGDRMLQDLGLVFEWDLVRVGRLQNQVGELYADLRGVADLPWLNFQVGRFQIPVGEAYLRFSRGVRDNPFVTNPVGATWWWDEGVRAHGTTDDGRFGYVMSVSDGETPFNADLDSDVQTTLKLFTRPTEWLQLSASGLRSGAIGSESSPAQGALWLGEAWPRAFGSGTSVESFDHGAPLADGPFQLEGVSLLGGDGIVHFGELARLWLAYGHVWIDSAGASVYDRELDYWIAELLFEGGAVAPELAPFYLGLRSSGLGTFDRDQGYLLDVRYGSQLGYNMSELQAVSLVLGWRLTQLLTLRAEYTRQRIELVRGVPDAIERAGGSGDFVAVDLRLDF